MTKHFDPLCRLCPRLASLLDEVRRTHPGYHAAPVPPFGDPQAHLFIVGLAPGMHGANRTGRPFTGDYAGLLLYRNLFDAGFGDQPESIAADDGLTLTNARISNAVKCVPPANKPSGAEIATCNRYLQAELADLPESSVVLALGRVAHGAVLRAMGLKANRFAFGHALEHPLTGTSHTLVDSYHCSRYNVQTGRLSHTMFADLMGRVRDLVDRAGR